MNNRSHEDIARNAWSIYKQTMALEKELLQTFFDDFLDFEEQEQHLKILQKEELPF